MFEAPGARERNSLMTIDIAGAGKGALAPTSAAVNGRRWQAGQEFLRREAKPTVQPSY